MKSRKKLACILKLWIPGPNEPYIEMEGTFWREVKDGADELSVEKCCKNIEQ